MPLVEIEDRGAVRHVVLARSEKRNALSGEVIQGLGDAFRGAAGEDSVRVVVVVSADGVVITGSGVDGGGTSATAVGSVMRLAARRASRVGLTFR